jgi:fructose-1,6-bisphosphatase I
MTNNLNQILYTILDSCTQISQLLRQGETTNPQTINTSSQNSSGEQQKPLDILSNEIIKTHLSQCPSIYAISSEEEENAVAINPQGDYLISFDPLDGSSNIDVNMSVGTIFSILKKQPEITTLNQQFQQKGNQQIAAGFVVYGPATTAIIGISADYQDPQNTQIPSPLYEMHLKGNTWEISKTAIQCPKSTNEYAINASNSEVWQPPIQQYIADCNQGKQGKRQKQFNMRWVASMVADMYRIFTRGGVFIYPSDTRNPNGKIRLLYEANPMAFLIELAGGAATDGTTPLLDISVEHIHQKTPVILGSSEEIEIIRQYHL